MMEADPVLAVNTTKKSSFRRYQWGSRKPSTISLDGQGGAGVVVSMADFGTHYKLLIEQSMLLSQRSRA